MKCESRHQETDKVACRTIFPEGGLRGLAAISLENEVVKSRANSRGNTKMLKQRSTSGAA